jgi:hypothetical protein
MCSGRSRLEDGMTVDSSSVSSITVVLRLIGGKGGTRFGVGAKIGSNKSRVQNIIVTSLF